jgi:hypothetical protein
MPSAADGQRGRRWPLRSRRTLFVLLATGCLVGSAAYVSRAALRDQNAARPAADRTFRVSPVVLSQPHVVFRSLNRSDRTFGRVALAPLREPTAQVLTPLVCERVHFAAGTGLCLERTGRFGFSYRATIFGPGFRARAHVKLNGFPSRARVSPDGRLGATTVFVTGHSYAEPGQFSTQTTIIDLKAGRILADLESFAITSAGERIRSPDYNFWGVTFTSSGDRFYATLATRGETYLVEGDVSARRARVLHENVECPSLSPDGTRVAYKKRVGGPPSQWRLHVLDLATAAETPLAETRQVDDQVEWLDDGRILYRVDEEVWVVRADGRGRARRYVAAADSPAVVRTSDPTRLSSRRDPQEPAAAAPAGRA